MTDIKSFIDISLGLTLTDTLWIKEEYSDSTWADVNLYDNEFSEIVSQTAFMGGISDLSFNVPFAYYSFDDHIPQLMSREMYKRIDGIRDFSFVNHTNYPVSDERLSALNGFIRYRIKRLLELYNV